LQRFGELERSVGHQWDQGGDAIRRGHRDLYAHVRKRRGSLDGEFRERDGHGRTQLGRRRGQPGMGFAAGPRGPRPRASSKISGPHDIVVGMMASSPGIVPSPSQQTALVVFTAKTVAAKCNIMPVIDEIPTPLRGRSSGCERGARAVRHSSNEVNAAAG
jgi:hypothetical protein